MATVPDENVHCVAVDGTFDDCQVCTRKMLSKYRSQADSFCFTPVGHCQDPLLGRKLQRHTSSRSHQLDQLGPYPRSDRLLLPRLPSPPGERPREPYRQCAIRCAYWKLWRHLGWILRQAIGLADEGACRCDQ